MEMAQWLALNADKISVISLLVALLVALQRQWIVPGWAFRECVEDRDRFEGKVEAIAKSNEDKIAQLQAEVAALQAQRGRSR